jgi:hypothetical protein
METKKGLDITQIDQGVVYIECLTMSYYTDLNLSVHIVQKAVEFRRKLFLYFDMIFSRLLKAFSISVYSSVS